MIRSMTGFGRGEAAAPRGTLQIEIRTLNHRFFETSNRLPENFLIFEDKIRVEIAKKIKRGKVNLSLTYESPRKSSPKLVIDTKLARKYKDLLLSLKHSLKVKDDIRLSQIISFPNVITIEEMPKDEAKLWPNVKATLDRALHSLVKMREQEGKDLADDILKRKKTILKDIILIERRAKLSFKEYRVQLLKKIKELSSGKINLDKGRVELEVALFAKNSDISEELTRIKAHLGSFEQALKHETGVGRKLDFITQELHREINTVGQKTNDYKISQLAIAIKGEIEKIREQVQNIE
ncbi:MAG: YicC/YloC family endoribonuclease [Candidatus Omnitrophota bacterium]|nr:YicC/YloC family endoribonuclease [Candidatus Omnitrophota bacterium]